MDPTTISIYIRYCKYNLYEQCISPIFNVFICIFIYFVYLLCSAQWSWKHASQVSQDVGHFSLQEISPAANLLLAEVHTQPSSDVMLVTFTDALLQVSAKSISLLQVKQHKCV
jgi:hypothetical protein